MFYKSPLNEGFHLCMERTRKPKNLLLLTFLHIYQEKSPLFDD